MSRLADIPELVLLKFVKSLCNELGDSNVEFNSLAASLLPGSGINHMVFASRGFHNRHDQVYELLVECAQRAVTVNDFAHTISELGFTETIDVVLENEKDLGNCNIEFLKKSRHLSYQATPKILPSAKYIEETLRAEIERLNNQVQRLTKENEQLHSIVDDMTVENNNLEEKLQSMINPEQLQRLTKENEKLCLMVSALEERLKSANKPEVEEPKEVSWWDKLTPNKRYHIMGKISGEWRSIAAYYNSIGITASSIQGRCSNRNDSSACTKELMEQLMLNGITVQSFASVLRELRFLATADELEKMFKSN